VPKKKYQTCFIESIDLGSEDSTLKYPIFNRMRELQKYFRKNPGNSRPELNESRRQQVGPDGSVAVSTLRANL
jgi:hypothetical protein